MHIQLNEPQIIKSPTGTDLKMTLFKSHEGIEQKGVNCYEGLLTFKELVDHFDIEKDSTEIGEAAKRQRDVGTSRINGLKTYWATSEGTVLPSMTFFANELDLRDTHFIGNKTLVEATLKSSSDRFIADGQGRTAFIQWLIANKDNIEFESHTIGFKLIVTNTPTLSTEKAAAIIKQLFADYHVKLIKPNASISKHFDNSSIFSRLMNECLDVELEQGTVKQYIALHGKIKQGHIWTFQQFTAMMQRFLNITAATAKKSINTQQQYIATLNLCKAFLKQLFTVLPTEFITSTKEHDTAMFTRAIFANALGYVGRSLLDEMLLDNSKTWNLLTLDDIPITDKSSPFWLDAHVTMQDGNKIKIIKSTDTRIGSLICRKLRIYPCHELSA